ncbi:hypothetical protein RSOL_487400, partial [Rhizoctonia solani AG-3 Rhs1AP]
MRDLSIKSYASGFLRSEVEGVKAGELLRVSKCSSQEYNTFKLPPEHPVTAIKEEESMPLSFYVGRLGMPAFYGL